ncbi:MAG: hypothetical protein U0842_09700 [Candidatus Binatia bacterium]
MRLLLICLTLIAWEASAYAVCPGTGPNGPCSGFGTCNVDTCSCSPGFSGPDCFSPVVISADPATGIEPGLTTVTLVGHLFGNSGSVRVNGTLAFLLSYTDSRIQFLAPDVAGVASVTVERTQDGRISAGFPISFVTPTVQCPALAPPANGRVSSTDGRNAGSVATFTCDAGYEPTSVATLTCSASGEWSAPFPACVNICETALLTCNQDILDAEARLATAQENLARAEERVLRLEALLAADAADHLGVGSTVGAGSVLGCRAKVGKDVEIGASAFLGNGARIGAEAVIGARVTFGSGVSVGAGAVIGDDAVLGDRVVVRRGAIVPPGTSVPAGTVVSR